MSGRARNTLAVVLVVLGGVATLGAASAAYLDRVLVDRNGFADRVVRAVDEPAVSRELGDRLAEAIVSASPDVIAGQRLIEDAAQSVLSSGALDGVVRRAALLMHDQAFTAKGEELSLDLADGIEIVGSLLGTRAPELRTQLEPQLEAEVVRLRHEGGLSALRAAADTIAGLSLILPLVAVGLFGAAIGVATDRARAFRWSGLAIVVVAVGLVACEVVVRVILARQHFVAADAADAAASVFLRGLLTLALLLGVAGAAIAAAGSGRLGTDTTDRTFGRTWDFLRVPPSTTGRRVLRIVALLVLGGLLLLHPLGTLRVAALLLGFLVLVEALTETIAVCGGGRRAQPRETDGARGRSRAVAVAVGVAGVLGVVAVVAFALGRVPGTHASVPLTCNGSAELCDRPLDRVAFPAAHNAMSSAEDGFIDPNHRRSLVAQLDGGIRGLLVDSLLARPTDRRSSAITVLSGEVRETARREIGDRGTVAIQDIIGRRLARPTGPPQPFLCHIVCELGALPMRDELAKIRDWLERNPDEVLVIVIQDLVSAEETERVFRESGLYDDVWTWNADEPAPTLRQMIEADRRVLVMAEADGIADGWYQPGYERLLKETPYANPSLEALASDASCRPNRGKEANPLFLVNHWVAVYPPKPTAAAVANRRDVLLDRVTRCRRIRNAFPNLIAVDFAGIGDVVAVAAQLNGVPEP